MASKIQMQGQIPLSISPKFIRIVEENLWAIFLRFFNPRQMPVRVDPSPHNFNWLSSPPPPPPPHPPIRDLKVFCNTIRAIFALLDDWNKVDKHLNL